MPYGLECYISGTAWDQSLGSSISHNAHYIKLIIEAIYQNTSSLGDNHVTCVTRLDAIVNQIFMKYNNIIVPLEL